MLSRHFHSAAPLVGIATAYTGNGYWVVNAKGAIYNFGAVKRYYNSTRTLKLAGPIVGISTIAGNDVFILIGADGGVFATNFGQATFLGSIPLRVHHHQMRKPPFPIVGGSELH